MGFAPHSLTASELAALMAADRNGEPFLAFRDATGDLRLAPLAGLDRVSVGRTAGNDLVLDWDPQVSRAHAQLERVGGVWLLVDDGLSRNGCYVGGERVQGRTRLADGAMLRFGGTSILFRAPGPGADSTVAATAAALVRLTGAERRVLVALCRPLLEPGSAATPAANREIADGLCLSPAGVKTHIRSLFGKLDVEDLPQNRKRAELARRAIEIGLVSVRDLRD
jgi:pSer/pThr/pTyr-binding forkhead associated (FHA) protein